MSASRLRRAAHPLAAVLLVAAAWLSSGREPWHNAVGGARAPVDFARDFVAARALARGERRYAVDAETRNQEALAAGVPEVPTYGGPYLAHPPPSTVALLPLAALGFEDASFVWLVLSLAALAFLAAVIVGVVRADGRAPPFTVAALTAALALWPPVLHNVEKGQWSILLAALIAAGWRAATRARTGAAGAAIGVAASLKVSPGVTLGYWVARRPRAALVALAVAAAIAAATLPVTGVGAWRSFFAEGKANVDAFETWYANTASLHALYARLFIGGPFATPWLAAPRLGRALQLGSSLLLLAVAALVTVRARRATAPAIDRALFALWATLAVLLNPLAWSHNVVFLALPVALLARDGESTTTTAPFPTGLTAALGLLSVPKETLYRLAGPPPSEQLGAVVLSLHAFGALLIFVLAARRAWRGAD